MLATDAVCAVLELTEVPDNGTLCRMFRRLGQPTLQAKLRRVLADLQPHEEVIAGDSTGYRPSQASAYFQTRSGRQFRDWFRGAEAVGAQSQLILAHARRMAVPLTMRVFCDPCGVRRRATAARAGCSGPMLGLTVAP